MRPMFCGSYHEIENLSNLSGEDFILWLGIFVKPTHLEVIKIREIEEGDYLVFQNAGAYCFSMSSNYNSRYKPKEVFWIGGE